MNANNLLTGLVEVEKLRVNSNDGAAWELSCETSKMELLTRLIASGNELILEYSENPIEDQMPGHWERLDEGVWVVPSDAVLHYDALWKWLNYGNWVLYKSSQRKVWRMGSYKDADKVLSRMKQEEVSICLYSFHDNDPWFLLAVEGVS